MSLTLRQPEYRKDPLSDGWVVIAAERSGRPDEFREIPFHRAAGPCPFCRGNETSTPEEIAQLSGGSTAQWKVRVVPNKFPALVRCDGVQSSVVSKTFKNGMPSLFTSVRVMAGMR